jgi:hypothetical protein
MTEAVIKMYNEVLFLLGKVIPPKRDVDFDLPYAVCNGYGASKSKLLFL